MTKGIRTEIVTAVFIRLLPQLGFYNRLHYCRGWQPCQGIGRAKYFLCGFLGGLFFLFFFGWRVNFSL
jgi:hypothetical protein